MTQPARNVPRRWSVAFGTLSVLALAGLGALSAVGAPPAEPSAAPPHETASPAAHVTATPPRTTASSPSPASGGDRPLSSPLPAPTAAPTATPAGSASPAPTRDPAAAPASADDFDMAAQVIAIGFPMKETTRYRYRDNWGDLRSGTAEHYNHAHSRRDGELLRAHDGIDIYAPRGEPVLAPFDGVAAAPETLWQPWYRKRYGRTAVIVSDEPTSAGYIALLSHLDRLWVEPGQRVRRGEVLGVVGNTGNAEGGPPHVHFELRAPFPLTWLEVGEERAVDAFNPFPSLRAADPRRSG